MNPDGVLDDMREAIDSTPRYAAAIGLGAIALLFFLKRAGFRFVVGVNVGR